MQTTTSKGGLLDLSEDDQRRREYNRGPLLDCFPRLPSSTLETLLDKLISKNIVYDLSESKLYNTRRYTSLVIAHIRHQHSSYESLLQSGVERYEARRLTRDEVWRKAREWCPWDSANECLDRCMNATLIRPEERGLDWDPMDLDEESDVEVNGDDPMDLD